MQRFGDLAADALDAAYRLDVELLTWELNRRVARMHPCELDMLADGVGDDLAALGYGVNLDFLSVLDELAHHDGVLLRNIGSQLEEAVELFLVGADIHRCPREDVAGTHQHGEANLGDELVDIREARQLLPAGLVDAELVEHGGELVAVLCIIDVFGLRPEDGDALRVELESEVIGDLSARREDDTAWRLQIKDVKYALEGQLIEVQTVGDIVVRADGLGIIVDHHRAVALLADRLQGVDATPVEFYRAADAVST